MVNDKMIFMPNPHRPRRRDAAVESRRVGGVHGLYAYSDV